MKFDYISDLHLDFIFKYYEIPTEEQIISWWYTLRPKNKILLIGGDIGHFNKQNIYILDVIQRNFYDKIIFVLGNHDYYLIYQIYQFHMQEEWIEPNYKSSLEKIKNFKKMLLSFPNLILLDGTTITFKDENITIGGAMGWYNDSYYQNNKDILKQDITINFYKNLTNEQDLIQQVWLDSVNDSRKILPLMSYDAFFETEYKKIDNIVDKCDVMLTHYLPSTNMDHQNKIYNKYISTCFFCFDGSELLNKFKGKIWLYGHNHVNMEFKINNHKLISNSLGYPTEIYKPKLKSISI